MVEYEVVPHQGIGPITFGMSREQSRAAMGITPKTFRKSGQDTVEYKELSADESVTAKYKGQNVFETKAQDLVNFKSQKAPYDLDDPGFGPTTIQSSVLVTSLRT